jgi:hypothetical protein
METVRAACPAGAEALFCVTDHADSASATPIDTAVRTATTLTQGVFTKAC